MTRAPHRAGWGVLALTVLLAGCSGDGAGPAPVAPAGVHVTQVWPAPRATGVLETATVWAAFDTLLDPATVDDRHVFLKLDTQRVPITVTWLPQSRRIQIQPQVPLTIARTHTVELAPTLRTADGAELTGGYWWQFRVTGAAEPRARWPASGARGESPVVMLEWQGTDPVAGELSYRLYAGADSAQVAARALPPLATELAADHVAQTPWPLGTTTYWAVTTSNATTGDTRVGPVAAFTTLPAGTPTAGVRLPIRDWGFVGPTGAPVCNRALSLTTGGSYHTTLRWEWRLAATDRRLASARLELGVSDTSTFVLPYATRDRWDPCAMTLLGPPRAEKRWGIGRGQAISGNRVRYTATALASLMEAVTRGRAVDGWVLVSSGQIRVAAGSDPNASSLDLVYYQVPATAPPGLAGDAAPVWATMPPRVEEASAPRGAAAPVHSFARRR